MWRMPRHTQVLKDLYDVGGSSVEFALGVVTVAAGVSGTLLGGEDVGRGRRLAARHKLSMPAWPGGHKVSTRSAGGGWWVGQELLMKPAWRAASASPYKGDLRPPSALAPPAVPCLPRPVPACPAPPCPAPR